jgi:segregation and condensation protein A
MAHTVTVGDFEGPFDLLLQLIAQRRVDVYDVALADITDDYLAVVRAMDTVDLEATTEFLVIAATLLELKAARLLPTDEEPEIDEFAVSARDLLYARLLDYQVFAEAAAFLGGRLEDQKGYIGRLAPLEEQFVGCVPPVHLDLTADDIESLYSDVLAQVAERRRPVDTSHLPPIAITVEQASEQMVDRLVSCGGRSTFRALTEECASRIEVAVAFLAVLDLYKSEHVEVSQPVNFGELVVELAPGGTGIVGSGNGAVAQRSQGEGERERAGGRGSPVVQGRR